MCLRIRAIFLLTLLIATPAMPAVDCPTALLEYGYQAANGQRHQGTLRIPLEETRQSNEMVATFWVISAGRAIQTLIKDWAEEKAEPSFSLGAQATTVSSPLTFRGVPLLPPVAATDDQTQTSETRGKRFAKVLRDYAQLLKTQTRSLPGLSSALAQQFYALDSDLAALANVFEQAQEYRGYRSRGASLESLSFSRGGFESTNALESLQSSSMQLTSGGTMSDSSFWDKVKAQQIPSLEDFSFDGFLKRFRLASTTPALPANYRNEPAFALGDSLYFPQSRRLLIQVGMSTNIDEATYLRPPLNLVVALDISGSMSSSDAVGSTSTRLEGAKRALGDLVSQLKPGDRITVLAFDDKLEVLQDKLVVTRDTNFGGLLDSVRALKPRGGTNIGNAQKTAYQTLDSLAVGSDPLSQNRVVLITDAMATSGELNAAELENLAMRAAARNQYTTVVGVGREFSRDLASRLANAPGGMFFYAASGDELYKLFAQFDTRMVSFGTNFAARLIFEGLPGEARVVAVYGSGVSDPANDTLPRGTVINGQTVLSVPTLAFADRRNVDPNAGGGAFVIEVQLGP